MLLRTLVVFGLLGILSADTCTNSSGCPCTGAPGQCPQAGFCDPDNNTCVAEDGEIFCGSYGAYLLCADDGVVTQECGSGKDADCSNNGDCGEKTWESIGCDFPGLSPQNGYVPTTWHCGDYGTRLSCEQEGGSVLIGVCGSGEHADCKGVCNGYHAILCAKATYFHVNWNACQWESKKYGEWAYCPEGFIGAGHCGSGKHADCGDDVWHELQCCPLVYNTSSFI